jgi:peptide deformylase
MLALKRPAEIMVNFKDVNGEEQNMTAKGVAARIILHEYDHMLGVNFTQYASNFKLKLEIDKIKKRRRKFEKMLKRGRNGR